MNRQFSKEVINKLKYYVYIYSDPETEEIFYVGKGIGNRVFSHLIDSDDPLYKTHKGQMATA
ncbi:hypothetical protein D0S48_13550 [Psychrobacillus sp. AK 1817]|uniref:hypothetical protein n=1 Tax=Psychrobacillus sp. AK 1817 TaxID=2303505 RepID=UPI001244DB1F|nr:hypothetical protein [Psychrobacillus sp. AK 1817]QEY21607.1 hypothetical protein D0S48_13550 [Psychrobacillus sp. AK 1817]